MHSRGTILFIGLAPGLGGSVRSLATVLAHVPETRRVVARPPDTSFSRYLAANDLADEILDLRLGGPGRVSWVASRVNAALSLALWARRHRGELTAIHANGLAELNLAALASRVSGGRVVVWVHDWQVSAWSRRLAPFVRRVAARVCFAPVSETSRRMVLASGVAGRSHTVVVPNPVDPSQVAGTKRTRSESISIGYLGTPASYKGFHLLPCLIRAVEADHAGPRSLRWLVFSGPRSMMADTWAQLETLGGAVELPGKRADVASAYAECDIVVCPSLEESFGRVAAEAMANGIPVVASDLPALRDVVGDAGVLVPPGDIAAMASALRRLIGDEALRSDLGGRGRARSPAFEPARIVPLLIRAYSGLPPVG